MSQDRVTVLVADLTDLAVDAVVNAANVDLHHGGGLAGALVRAGGTVIQRESDDWISKHGPLRRGQAAVTSAGTLPCRHVIHVAGPIFDPRSADNGAALRAATHAALATGAHLEIGTIALPALSAGIYGYPADQATAIIASEAVRWASVHALPESILLVAHDHDMAQHFRNGLESA